MKLNVYTQRQLIKSERVGTMTTTTTTMYSTQSAWMQCGGANQLINVCVCVCILMGLRMYADDANVDDVDDNNSGEGIVCKLRERTKIEARL